MVITSSNVIFGSVTYASSGKWTFSQGGTPSTAVKVFAKASVPLFFGSILGVPTFATSCTSTSAFVRNKICLVIDRSASMAFDMTGTDWSYPPGGSYYTAPVAGSRWSYLSQATSSFLSILATAPVQNQVGMVTFSDAATTDCAFSTNFAPVNTAVKNYGKSPIYGGTNLSAGLQAAINLFNSSNDGTPWNYIIIIESDGDWNEGNDPTTMVPTMTSMGIQIDTVGLLVVDATMQALAADTNGTFCYAANAAALTAAFQALANTIPVILIQ